MSGIIIVGYGGVRMRDKVCWGDDKPFVSLLSVRYTLPGLLFAGIRHLAVGGAVPTGTPLTDKPLAVLVAPLAP